MSARYFEAAAHAVVYANFRPLPPQSLILSVMSFLKEKYAGHLDSAADVGCGSGQSTKVLSEHFINVTGLDIAEAQIGEAVKRNTLGNITFKVSCAEKLPFENESLQLVTAGQACHWFNIPKFFQEVDRILVPNGVLALYGYQFPRPVWEDKSDELFNLMNTIYVKDTKQFWGKERKYVDNAYTDKEFIIPYIEHKREDCFIHEQKTSVRDFAGYISSWSGFRKYKSTYGDEAAQKRLDDFVKSFMETVGVSAAPEETELTLRYPFFLLMGRKPSS